MNKRVVGIYNSDEAVMLEIDKLKALGHDEYSIYVLAKDMSRAFAIVEETGVQVEEIPVEGNPEPKGAGVFSRVFYALDYETQHSGVATVLKSAGVTEDEVGSYVRKIEEGYLVVLSDAEAPRQSYSDESDAGYANEEQSMQYYNQTRVGKRRFNEQQQGVSAPTQSENVYAEDVHQSFYTNPERPLVYREDSLHETYSSDVPIISDEIYVEHIYFDSGTQPLETTDEVLTRVPITEERVRVIKEKVVTGEIIVRKRKL